MRWEEHLMIQIAPEDLHLVGKVARTRRRPNDTDGIRSWCRHYNLSYLGDGFLTVSSTDNRLVGVHFLSFTPKP